jgi:FMN phosphatase YigB (HAD superfamily)
MIRALIFDCFGVLYRDNIDMLYDVVPEDKQREFRDLIHASDYGLISRQDYFVGTAALSGRTVEEVQEIESRQFILNESLLARARQLKNDYKIGLLSNIGDTTMDRLFPEPGRSELFDMFLLSSDVGLIKPSRRLFELAAVQLGCLPEECVMIDDIMYNVEGARMADMQAILFTTNPQFEIDLAKLMEKQDA